MKGLSVENLSLEIGGRGAVVDGVSFAVQEKECVVLLGESGCGKSLTALALMRLLPEGIDITQGKVGLDGEDLFGLPESSMRAVRGGKLAMIFQEPQTSLNPVLTIGQQIAESLAVHQNLHGAPAQAEAARLLEAVGLPVERLANYPFQLSGGQRQRALIAMMLAGDPAVLIADEPTTALDVTVQAQILKLLKDLQQQRGMGLLLITHDLDVARDMADRVAVMYAGQIVEWASRDQLYGEAFHPYTRRLFSVLPSAARRGQRLEQIPGVVPQPGEAIVGCRFADRCSEAFDRCRKEAPGWHERGAGHGVRCHLADDAAKTVGWISDSASTDAVGDGGCASLIHPTEAVCRGETLPLQLTNLQVHFPIRTGVLQRTVGHMKAVDGVSLSIDAGETLALVGESGCGKTTLARAALRLIEPTSGQIHLAGEDITRLGGEALRQKRSRMQIVFQDPFSSLNPRMRVGEILEEGLISLQPLLTRAERASRVKNLLDQVGLPAEASQRYPHEFSGGQRQRIAIARALAVEPSVLICDEPTSALDVSVQAQILNLLADLQAQRGLSYLFITHNLAVVSYLAHRVAVMYRGKIVEEGACEALLANPAHPYTRILLASAPGQGMSDAVSPRAQPLVAGAGCAFLHRCPQAQPICGREAPPLVTLKDGRRVACHTVP